MYWNGNGRNLAMTCLWREDDLRGNSGLDGGSIIVGNLATEVMVADCCKERTLQSTAEAVLHVPSCQRINRADREVLVTHNVIDWRKRRLSMLPLET